MILKKFYDHIMILICQLATLGFNTGNICIKVSYRFINCIVFVFEISKSVRIGETHQLKLRQCLSDKPKIQSNWPKQNVTIIEIFINLTIKTEPQSPPPSSCWTCTGAQ